MQSTFGAYYDAMIHTEQVGLVDLSCTLSSMIDSGFFAKMN